jgi:hypothetical protein
MVMADAHGKAAPQGAHKDHLYGCTNDLMRLLGLQPPGKGLRRRLVPHVGNLMWGTAPFQPLPPA